MTFSLFIAIITFKIYSLFSYFLIMQLKENKPGGTDCNATSCATSWMNLLQFFLSILNLVYKIIDPFNAVSG